MGRQSSDGKSGLKSSSQKRDTANRGGMHPMPPTRRVPGASGVEGTKRRVSRRARPGAKAPAARRRRAA
jgi:hypothetical protein